MRKLVFNDKRITVLLKFLCDNDTYALSAVKYFFEDIDEYLLGIINKGLNFEGEHGKGYYRINYKPDTILNYGDKNSDMLEITKIIDGNKQVLNIYYGLLDKNTKPSDLSPFALMEIKGVFDETQVLNKNFEYRNIFLWSLTKNGDLELYIDNMTKNECSRALFSIISPLRTDVLEESYPRKEKPLQIENNYNLFGDSLLIRSGELPYYKAYKQMFENEVLEDRRKAFFGLEDKNGYEK